MGFLVRRIASSLVSRARISLVASRRYCSSQECLPPPLPPPPRVAAEHPPPSVEAEHPPASAAEEGQPQQEPKQQKEHYRNTEQGYEAWWRMWKEHRQTLSKVSIQDILASEGTVVMDANIGSVFSRMILVEPAPPHRAAFHKMLMLLIERSRLSAPPKLLHKYSVSNKGAQKILIPYGKISEADKRVIGEIGDKLSKWILDNDFVMSRHPERSVDFIVTILQCAFLYKSTILLTNNKDYFYLMNIAKEIQEWLADNFSREATLLNVESVRLVYVLEQMELDIYKVGFRPEKVFPPPRMLQYEPKFLS